MKEVVLTFGQSEDDVNIRASGDCYRHKITRERKDGGPEQLLCVEVYE